MAPMLDSAEPLVVGKTQIPPSGSAAAPAAAPQLGGLKQRAKMALRRLTPDFIYVLRKCLHDFYIGHGGYPNLLYPRTFSEKIQHRKLFDRRPILTQFADKVAVRDYVRERVGNEILTTLYHVTDDPNDIPLDLLPDRFVVKPTHGCGWVQIVRDKSALDVAQLRRTCAGWLAENFFYRAGEWAYKNIKPRLMFEELLDDGMGAVPNDIKFFCFGGRAQFITVDIARFGNHRRNIYDMEWNLLRCGFQRPLSDEPQAQPARFADMVRYAEKLAAGHDFLRIDLYYAGDRITFGEITATPASGLEPFWPGGTDLWIGSLWPGTGGQKPCPHLAPKPMPKKT
jgi:hypothetical protein